MPHDRTGDEAPAPAVALGRARVLYGACSWANRSLVRDSDWYPKRTMKAAERLAYYASRFPLVEVESTYWFPPTPEVARQWVDRTPPGFVMDVRAWSLLTGQATLPSSLWPDLQDDVRPETRDSPNLYAAHLSADALAEAWARFVHALRPLHDAGRLGAVVLQYPHWFSPKDETYAELAMARAALDPYRVCVEFASERWLDRDWLDPTLERLEALEVAVVCVDAPQLPPVVATTADLAVVRFHGRDHPPWGPQPHRATARSHYRYTDDELQEWIPRVRELAQSAREVHLLVNTNHRDHAVRAAERLAELLRSEGG